MTLHGLRKPLKSDLNEVLFVLEMGELICINIKTTNICNLKKNPPTKNIWIMIIFLVLFSGFIRMKVDTTLILAGCSDVVDYSLLRKWRQTTWPAKSSVHFDLDKTRKQTNTFRLHNYFSNWLKLYLSHFFNPLTIFAQRVFRSGQSLIIFLITRIGKRFKKYYCLVLFLTFF